MTLKSKDSLCVCVYAVIYAIYRLKEHDVHELAAAKEKELEKMRRALRIKEDRADGAAFR